MTNNTNRHAWGSDVYHRPDPETDCPVVEIKPRLLNDYGCQSLVNGDAKMPEPETTASATETLREALKKHHLRLAQPGELREQTYLLECRVCGEVTEIQPWCQIMGFCVICRLSWQQSAPTFHVLLPDTVPVPPED